MPESVMFNDAPIAGVVKRRVEGGQVFVFEVRDVLYGGWVFHWVLLPVLDVDLRQDPCTVFEELFETAGTYVLYTGGPS